MTLRCQCGGPIQCTGGFETSNGFSEQYECPECGGVGGYRHYDRGGSDTWGCVVSVTEVTHF